MNAENYINRPNQKLRFVNSAGLLGNGSRMPVDVALTQI